MGRAVAFKSVVSLENKNMKNTLEIFTYELCMAENICFE